MNTASHSKIKYLPPFEFDAVPFGEPEVQQHLALQHHNSGLEHQRHPAPQIKFKYSIEELYILRQSIFFTYEPQPIVRCALCIYP